MKRKLPFWLGILIGVAAMCIVVIIGVISGAVLYGIPVWPGQSHKVSDSGSASGSGSSSAAVSAANEKIEAIETLVDSYFLWDIDEELMEEKIVDGYVAGLDDKYAVYYTPEEFEDLQESVSGSYAGIGVSIIMNDDNKIEVYKVFSGSPAEEAGVHVGDLIIEADNVTEFQALDDLVVVVRGTPGTYVDITVDRGGEEISFSIERRNIEMETVTWEMLEGGIGYIYIAEFDTVTVDQFNTALDELESQGMKSLILDLRDNPGGDYATVVAMSDRVLPEGPIMTVKDKEGTIITENSDAQSRLDLPMAILINGNSASASEVFVGAIQDYNMATIIGEQSYGKGIVQGIFSLPDGSGVKFTTEEYYTPSGDSIHGVGITPDIVIELPEDAYDDGILDREEDTQLQKAIEVLS